MINRFHGLPKERFMRSILPLVCFVPVAALAVGGTLAGSGTVADPWQVADYEDLKMVGFAPYTMNGHYRLVADIDAGKSKQEKFSYDTTGTNRGFKPIGQLFPAVADSAETKGRYGTVAFSGSFNGAGHVIRNLEIVSFVEPSTGIFSVLDSSARLDSLTLKDYYFKGIYSGGVAGVNRGTINEVHVDTDTLEFVTSAGGLVSENYGTITNSSFSGTLKGAYLGGIAYENFGTISKCKMDIKNGVDGMELTMFGGIAFKNRGVVSDCKAAGGIHASVNIGGIASENYGTVERCSSSVDIVGMSGDDYAGLQVKNVAALGGLVAIDSGKIYDSHASGNVTASVNNAGGLVGIGFGQISRCTASGVVKVVAFGGAFIGTNRGTIDSSSASGKIVGSAYLGGFAGYNFGTVSNSHATGDVHSTAASAGGFVAKNETGGKILNCYATGNVNGYVDVGGFAGENAGDISTSHATGHVKGGTKVGGFVARQDSGRVEKSYATGHAMGEIYVGGFAGLTNNSSIDQCYSTGSVLEGYISASGFVGAMNGSTVTNSFSLGDVYSVEEEYMYAASFVGIADESSSIKNCFSTGAVTNKTAGLDKVCAMAPLANVEGYYWDISNCTVIDTANYAISLTDEQMTSPANFDKLDFNDMWTFNANFKYPVLNDVDFDASVKDSMGFFQSEPERYVPGQDNPKGKTKIVTASVAKKNLQVRMSSRFVQGSVQFTFVMPRAGMAEMRLYDFRGREVGRLSKRHYEAGLREENLLINRLMSGRYVAVMLLDGKIAAKSTFAKR